MEELESDGLLSSDIPSASAPQPEPAEQVGTPTAAATSSPDHTTVGALGTQLEPPNGGVKAEPLNETEALTVSVEAEASAAEAIGAGPAEQRVLGDLQSAPDWFEVMDMASRKVYFWNSSTNDVAWEPPPGSEPRSQAEYDAVASSAPEQRETTSPSAALEGAGLLSTLEAGNGSPGRNGDATVGTANADSAKALKADGATEAATGERPAELEEGQLPGAFDAAAAASSAAGPPASRVASIPQPSADVAASSEALVWRLRQAVAQLCGPVPRLVWLAVEAEVRHRDWQALSAVQRAAAEAGDAAGSLSWERYEAAAAERLVGLDADVTEALQEAEQGLTEAERAAVEEGELPLSVAADEMPPEAADGTAGHLAGEPSAPAPQPRSPAPAAARPPQGPSNASSAAAAPDDVEMELDTERPASPPPAPPASPPPEAAATPAPAPATALVPLASYAQHPHGHFPISLAPPLAAWSQYYAAMPRPMPGFPLFPPRLPYLYPPPYHPMPLPQAVQPPLPEDSAAAPPPLPSEDAAPLFNGGYLDTTSY